MGLTSYIDQLAILGMGYICFKCLLEIRDDSAIQGGLLTNNLYVALLVCLFVTGKLKTNRRKRQRKRDVKITDHVENSLNDDA